MIASPPSWIELARAAARTVAEARHGRREAALVEALADLRSTWPDLKLARQTLRTALLALNFVEEVRRSDPDYARTLERLPAIVVETLHRWHRYDAAAAKTHARDYEAGKFSVRRLMEAESVARKDSATGGRSGRSGRSLFEENLAESIEGFSVAGTRLRVVGLLKREPDQSERERVPAALLAKITLGELLLDEATPSSLPDLERFEAALLVAGPYADAETAAVRLADWVLRALGLLFYFSEVALVLASGPAPTEFAHLIPPEAAHRFLLLAPPDAES
jgi:hypothetical protein